MTHPTFEDRCIISCGMLHPEMTHLVESGFLNPRRILFTPPGLHALPDRLEEHLLSRLAQALDDLLLIQGDARRLPFVDRALLESLERPREALVEALRPARRGVLLGVLNRWGLLDLQRRLAGFFRPDAYDGGSLLRCGRVEATAALRRRWEDAHHVAHDTVPPWVALAAIDPALGRVHRDGLARAGRATEVIGRGPERRGSYVR